MAKTKTDLLMEKYRLSNLTSAFPNSVGPIRKNRGPALTVEEQEYIVTRLESKVLGYCVDEGELYFVSWVGGNQPASIRDIIMFNKHCELSRKGR